MLPVLCSRSTFQVSAAGERWIVKVRSVGRVAVWSAFLVLRVRILFAFLHVDGNPNERSKRSKASHRASNDRGHAGAGGILICWKSGACRVAAVGAAAVPGVMATVAQHGAQQGDVYRPKPDGAAIIFRKQAAVGRVCLPNTAPAVVAALRRVAGRFARVVDLPIPWGFGGGGGGGCGGGGDG